MGSDIRMVSETLTTDMGGDIGVVTALPVIPTDVVDKEEHFLSTEFTHRDGSTSSFERPSINLPAAQAANKGVTLLGEIIKTANPSYELIHQLCQTLDIPLPLAFRMPKSHLRRNAAKFYSVCGGNGHL